MADTKTVAAAKVITAAVLGAIVGSGTTKLYVENQDGTISQFTVAEQVASDALLENASEACLADVNNVGDNPNCTWGCRTRFAKDIPAAEVDGETGEKIPPDLSKVAEHEGWCCNGAWMPARVQTCLDEALAKMNAEPKVLEVEPR